MQQDGGTEERILRAAAEVFVARGRDGARMQEISERAGINRALLHYYFRSKERLYEEVFRREFGEYMGAFLDSIPDTDNMEAFLRAFVGSYIDNLARKPQLVSFVLWEIQQGGELFLRVLKDHLYRDGQVDRPFFIRAVERAVQAGRIRPVDPTQFIVSLIGACVYPFIARPILERLIAGLDVLSEAFLEKRKDEVFRLFWEGIHHEW